MQVALCYYKLDYYDVSLEILAAYLQVRLISSEPTRQQRTHASCITASLCAAATSLCSALLPALRLVCCASLRHTQTRL